MSNLKMDHNHGQTPWEFLGDLHDHKWTGYATMVTKSEHPDGSERYTLWHHGSPIVVAYSTGATTIDHHGYASKTTYDRINRCLPNGWGVGNRNHVPSYWTPDTMRKPLPFDRPITLSNVR